MPLLHHLIYQSQATEEFSVSQLREQLTHFQRYNAAHDITGLLLYTPGKQFMQVLEGEEEAVTHLFYDRIRPDQRHSSVTIISEGPWARRAFPAWSMGFVTEGHSELLAEPGFIALTSLRVLLPKLAPNRPALVHLLLEFIDTYDELQDIGIR
jgi:hypothetical protein